MTRFHNSSPVLIRSLYLVSVFPNKPVSFWHSKYQFGSLCPLSLDPLLKPGLICSPKKVKLDLIFTEHFYLYAGPHRTVENTTLAQERDINWRPSSSAGSREVQPSCPHRQSLPFWPLTNWLWPCFLSAHSLFIPHIVSTS